MKKRLSRNAVIFILVFIIILFSPIHTLSTQLHFFEPEAGKLYKNGLYNGISLYEYYPGLEMLADREVGIVMVVRLLNEEKNAMNLSDSEVDQLLSNFSDSSQISVWAKKQIAQAVKLEMVKGYPDNTLRPKEMLSSKMYCSMILKALGYDFEYNQSVSYFCALANATQVESRIFSQDGAINRDVMVGITYRSLSAPFKQDGKALKQKLLDQGVIKLDIKY